jgi:hypothetical protein
MRAISILALFMSVGSAMAQTSQKNAPAVVKNLCGKLIHSEDERVRNTQNTFETRTRNLPRASMRLYRADDGHACCAEVLLVAKTTTCRWGTFHFNTKKTAAGLDWIAVKPDGRENKLFVRYDPKRNSDQLCYQTFWEVNDAENSCISETITVE